MCPGPGLAQLITVDGQDIRGWKLDEVMPKLLGPAGSRSVCAHTRACAASTCETSSCSKNRLASSASNCNAVNAVRAQSHALAYAPRVSMLQRGPGVSAESQHGQCFHHKGARPKHQAVGVQSETLYRYLEITRYRGDSENIGGPAGTFETRRTGCCIFRLRGIGDPEWLLIF